MLHSISELREHQPEEKSVNRNGALPHYHTLALLHTVLGDKEKVSFIVKVKTVRETNIHCNNTCPNFLNLAI